MKINTLIYYEPECRGMRIGMSYIKRSQSYIGFYIGYSGWAIYSDNFFNVHSKLTEESLLQSDDIEQFEDEIQDKLQESMDSIWDNCVDNDSFIPYIKPKILKTFKRYKDDYGETVLIYESEGFDLELLKFLSKRWNLLTFYK